MSAVGSGGWYVIQLHERGQPLIEMFYSSSEQLAARVDFYKGNRLYRRIWWGFCPTTDRSTWLALGKWGDPLTG